MDYSHKSNERRRKRQRSQTTRVRNKIGLLFFRVVIAAALIGGFAAVGAVMGVYLGILENTPQLDITAIKPSNFTSIIYDNKTGAELERLSGLENRVYVTFNQIPKKLINAFVAIEDERFYSHNGIDIRGIGRAVYLLLSTGGKTTHGASTITQQLIKNKLGKFESDIVSKLQEQYLAIQFEKRLAEPDLYGSKEAAKNHILEVYLNTINLGRGCYGVQAAAMHYYGKDVADLTIAECATIAAVTQNPSWFPPDIRPANNKERAETVLFKMHELGFITDREYREALNTNVYNGIVQGATLTTDGLGTLYSYFTDALISEVVRDLQAKYNLTDKEAYNWIYSGGLQIYSTQDQKIQKIVDEAYLNDENFPVKDFEIDVEYRLTARNSITEKITNYNEKKTVKNMDEAEAFIESVKAAKLTANDDILAELPLLTPQPQSGFVIIDNYTGQVKAIAGGRGEKTINLSFNRATDSFRSPGSQFKTLAAYAPSLDLGWITPATVIDDVPYLYDFGDETVLPYEPRNWWGSTFEGLANVRRGIYRSMNVVSVKTMMDFAGIEASFAYLQNFGFTTLVEGEWRNTGGRNRYYTDKGPSLPLGGLTNGVKLVDLCAAYAVFANGGEYNKPIFYTKVLDHDGNVLLENIPQPRQVIKKTTAYLMTDMMTDTIRLGTGTKIKFDEVKMPIAGKTGTTSDTKDLGFSGYTPYYTASLWLGFDQQKKITDTSDSHKILWKRIMEEIHRNLPEKQFERPDGIVSAVVCKDSGMLSGVLCERDPRGKRVFSELFIVGTQPMDYCEAHRELRVCTESGRRAGYNCPEGLTETRVGFVRQHPLPEDTDAKITDRPYEFTPEMLSSECQIHGYYNPPDDDVNDHPYDWDWEQQNTQINNIWRDAWDDWLNPGP